MNKAAQTLGRMAKGKPKRYSAEELAKRTERLIAGRRQHLENRKQQQTKE